MLGLTNKQKDDLNEAIMEYLVKHNYKYAAEGFSKDIDMKIPEISNERGIRKDVLEKKWTSIVKLKKKTMDLEKQIKILKEEGTPALDSVLGKSSTGDSLPREPAKYTLQGHRAKITKVALHPYYSLAASASEDASIRLWEFE